jgi:putative SOS response-associated peptidase YedK
MALEAVHGRREGLLVRWGLVPSWVKDPAAFTLLINARSETAAEKPAFRNAMRHRRALIPASGFYEWHRPADRKAPRQPYFVRPRHGGIVAFGGLMETWSGRDGSEIDTGAILTTAANEAFAAIHERMPLVIAPEHFERWLDCRNYSARDVADLLVPADAGLFEAIPISDKVNRVANSGPDIQEPVDPASVPSTPGKARPARGNTKTGSATGQLKLF